MDQAEHRSKQTKGMVDSFGRRITYVRISVTDRCDLRCRYCMAEHMQFLPKRDLLSLEEIAELVDVFVARGVRKIRLTGGEPLVRRGIEQLISALGKRVGNDLDELTLTTNGTQLERFAGLMADAGVRRVNVSLDTRRPELFRHVTRGGDVEKVIRGIDAASAAGIAVKINMVALKGINDGDVVDMLHWCSGRGLDLTLIETMPLGEVEEDRTEHYLPLDAVKRDLDRRFELIPSLHRTGGPARYYEVAELGIRLGMITPLSSNFCNGCNRIRVAATGTVFGCLGHEQKVELRDALRSGGRQHVVALLDELLAGKPQRHDFQIEAARPAVARHMSVTGG